MITANRCGGLKNNAGLFGLLALLLLPSAGCVQLAALAANVTGGDKVPAEYTLTKGPLLVLIDPGENVVIEPYSVRQMHKTISDLFLEMGANRRVVPYENWQALQQSAKDYSRLSIRQIGEKLGADQVLYIRVDRFVLEEEPASPIYKGEAVVRVKVLSTEAKHDVRLWPTEEKGKRVSATTDPVAKDGDKSAGDISKELAVKTGLAVAKLFYEYRELEK